MKYDVIQLLFLYIKDYNPSELSWYHGDEKLEAVDCSGPYLSCRKLILSSVPLESSGNLYTCRGTELKEISWATIQIYVKGEYIKDRFKCIAIDREETWNNARRRYLVNF